MSTTRVLAIDGGTPLRTSPMPGWPAPGDAEVAAATQVLRSGRLNYWTGTEGRTLEAEYAAAVGRAHGIALANGTLALELALRAFCVGPGDEVIVPARTFIATASSVVAVGASPVVADIDPRSGNLTAQTVRDVLTERTRAIIPVHLGGWPVDMAPLVELAAERDLIVIEDCAQAHGATYEGRPAGALGSHAAAFSFCQDKIVPVGDGGLLVLDDDHAYERAWAYKDHGKSLLKVRDPEFMGVPGPFKWLHDSFGTNWRLDEMSAAVARVGLRNLEAWHVARRRNALQLAQGLSGLRGLAVPLPDARFEHAFYRLYAHVHPEFLRDGWDRDRIMRSIIAEGTPCQYGGCAEIYRERAFTAAGLGPVGRLPGAAQAHETSIAFFVHPTLGPDDISDTIAATQAVLEAASS
jgi:dTDP-4-amino-4,6-dideoxygalactose transaminase